MNRHKWHGGIEHASDFDFHLRLEHDCRNHCSRSTVFLAHELTYNGVSLSS